MNIHHPNKDGMNGLTDEIGLIDARRSGSVVKSLQPDCVDGYPRNDARQTVTVENDARRTVTVEIEHEHNVGVANG